MSKCTCFDLLRRDQQISIRNEVKEFGYMSVRQIKDLIEKNQFKTKADHFHLDPEFCISLSCYVDPTNPIFIDLEKKQIYTRRDLFEKFPFEELNTSPEKMFRRQEIGVFIRRVNNVQQIEYLMRDVSDSEFVSLGDNIRAIIRKGHVAELKATHVATTNIYIANEEWEEFCLMKKFIKGFQRFIPIEGGASFKQAVQALPWFLTTQTQGGQALLTNGSGLVEREISSRSPASSGSKRSSGSTAATGRGRGSKKRGSRSSKPSSGQ
jgi:hypothetical protein